MGKFYYILLDADNTLMDFDAAECYALKKTLEFYHLPYNEQIHKAYDRINSMLWEEFNHGKIKKEYLLTKRFADFYREMGWKEQKGYEEVNKRYLENLGNCPALMEGALDFCKEMSQEYKLYIITNGVTSTQKKRFAVSEIKDYITDIFIAEEIGCPKPEIEFFDYVFAHIEGFQKKRAIIVGDTLSSDIKGANLVGVSSCWYNPKEKKNNTEIFCNYQIKNFEELKSIIRGN